jgi:hypothetical protein
MKKQYNCLFFIKTSKITWRQKGYFWQKKGYFWQKKVLFWQKKVLFWQANLDPYFKNSLKINPKQKMSPKHPYLAKKTRYTCYQGIIFNTYTLFYIFLLYFYTFCYIFINFSKIKVLHNFIKI